MNVPILFCPRCAGPMVPARWGAHLRAGGMGLSRRLEATLVARFGAHVRADAPVPAQRAPWFCPACRVPLGADLGCPGCGGSLRDVLFALVELHPHRPPV